MDLIPVTVELEDPYGPFFTEDTALPAIPRVGDLLQLRSTHFAYHEVLRVRWDVDGDTYLPVIVVKK